MNQCICDDVNCSYKHSKNTENETLRETCKLNLDIAIQFYEIFGYTTCELGLNQINITKNRLKSMFYTVNKLMIGDCNRL
ncbi:MAG: hypothetical protein PHY47_12665 [Lachnospiraceae bacterium]|nr:hypothetical protein [Lachnospiraceae bacterium]